MFTPRDLVAGAVFETLWVEVLVVVGGAVPPELADAAAQKVTSPAIQASVAAAIRNLARV